MRECVDIDSEYPDPNSREALVDEFVETTTTIVEAALHESVYVSGITLGERARLSATWSDADGYFLRFELSRAEHVRAYEALDHDERCELEGFCIDAMCRYLHGRADDMDDPPIAMCGALPVMFEPDNHAMMLGARNGDNMTLESSHIRSDEQLRTLLAGTLALIWWISNYKISSKSGTIDS